MGVFTPQKTVLREIRKLIVWFVKPDLERLPFYTLFLGFIMTVGIHLLVVRFYWYDEVLLINISGNGLKGILEAIHSTPHPVGFYLFLKLFNTGNVLQTKLLSIVFYYLLIGLVTLYLYRSGIIKKFKLSVGLSLFFSSANHFIISSNIKHDFVTFPVLFALTALTLSLIESKDEHIKKFIIYSNILVFVSLICRIPSISNWYGTAFWTIFFDERKEVGNSLIYWSIINFCKLLFNPSRTTVEKQYKPARMD